MMLKLFHANTSVCSIKARIALVEKGLPWESALIDLVSGEARTPEYLALNPEGVVPTLLDDDFVVRESSAIIEHVDRKSAANPLMPRDERNRTITQMWLIRTIEIHASINTMSFATLFRERERATRTPEQTEARLATMPNPQAAAKRREIYAKGVESIHVDGALHTLGLMLKDMQVALESNDWLAGGAYGLADIAIVAYVDRLERLGMEGWWQARYPAVSGWLELQKKRPSYAACVSAYIPEASAEADRAVAARSWPALAARLGIQ